MNIEDWDKLLEQGLSGGPPRKEFREQALQESLAAFVQGRRSRARWRVVSLAAAAVVVAAVSFLLGRSSLPRGGDEAPAVVRPVAREDQRVPMDAGPSRSAVPPVAGAAERVAVPSDLVAWLEAARLFRQLGMEDRVARAVDRAYGLLPFDTAPASGAVATSDGGGDEAGFVERPVSDVTSGAAGSRFPILSALSLYPASAENASQKHEAIFGRVEP